MRSGVDNRTSVLPSTMPRPARSDIGHTRAICARALYQSQGPIAMPVERSEVHACFDEASPSYAAGPLRACRLRQEYLRRALLQRDTHDGGLFGLLPGHDL